MRIDELIELCQPSKHFIGLWVVRVKKGTTYTTLWSVSYIDLDNVHAETPCYKNPINALARCASDLKLLP